jgi:hypothetical protein
MKPLLKTVSWTAAAVVCLFLGTANLQAQTTRATGTIPNQAAATKAGLGNAVEYRSNVARTARQGMPVRGANTGNLNGMNPAMGQFGAYPGMYQSGYPGMNQGYPGMYQGGYPGMYQGGYPGMNQGGYPGMYQSPFGF